MPTATQILQTAASQIGYVEGGPNHAGNITKFWAALKPAWQGQPWCAAFVHWCLIQHGLDLRSQISAPYYCPSIEQWARRQGTWTSQPRPGDLALFGAGLAVHIGIVERVLAGGLIQTIEGNTSPTNAGSQNNGGGVYRRIRGGAWIRGYVRMTRYYDSRPTPQVGDRDRIARLERALHIGADGEWDTRLDRAARAVRATYGLRRPVGDSTRSTAWRAKGPDRTPREVIQSVQWALGVGTDGEWGAKTDAALIGLRERSTA